MNLGGEQLLCHGGFLGGFGVGRGVDPDLSGQLAGGQADATKLRGLGIGVPRHMDGVAVFVKAPAMEGTLDAAVLDFAE